MSEKATPPPAGNSNPWRSPIVTFLLLCAGAVVIKLFSPKPVPKPDLYKSDFLDAARKAFPTPPGATGNAPVMAAPKAGGDLLPKSETENDAHLRRSPWGPDSGRSTPPPADSMPPAWLTALGKPAPEPAPGATAPLEFSWQPMDTNFGRLFASIQLAVATRNDTRSARDASENALGAFPNSPYAAEVVSPAGVKVRLELRSDEIMEPSSVEVRIERPGQFAIVPHIIWKFDALLRSTQARPVNVTWNLSVNGGPAVSQTHTVTLEPVDVMPLRYRLRGGAGALMLYDYFAAFANEDHPKLDRILTEALDTHIVGSFSGLQSNDPERVKSQVLAIWWALQKRGIVYSDITTPVTPDDDVFTAMRVRLLDDVIEAHQANCIDGTLIFASALRRIGLEPVICVVPGHAFLGFYLDQEKKNPAYLETTFLNNRNVYLAAKKALADRGGASAARAFFESDNQTCPTTPELARAMFDLALEHGQQNADKADAAAARHEGFIYRIDLGDVRKREHILPIPSVKRD